MENLWAPWRIDYIMSKKPPGCIFCDKSAEDRDEENLILHRGRHHFIILNAFPYNNGHMMVVPYRHTASLAGWTGEEQQEMMELAALAVELLKRTMRPDGFNLGINMGAVGGAGVADHIHMHIVPRWNGDTNFMPVLSDTRVISEGLQATYRKLKGALSDMK
ncbi:MAG TPA: HIT domain-containing protein [Methanothrix sp.]|jgi:ATP adenylyltransferase|nr:HIT domain-containing protein [Methanothrix sp.]HOV81360.1 HIT domain-containing protein [Methanothrix sp.]HQE88419.1 HIT domain-containing protein [Methanothrix sp.]